MLNETTLKLTLYSGPECGLCDQAKELLKHVEQSFLLDMVNVKANHDMYHLYGARIPVIKRDDTSAELGWPFSLEQLSEFLS